jgi:hypothetical protein
MAEPGTHGTNKYGTSANKMSYSCGVLKALASVSIRGGVPINCHCDNTKKKRKEIASGVWMLGRVDA